MGGQRPSRPCRSDRGREEPEAQEGRRLRGVDRSACGALSAALAARHAPAGLARRAALHRAAPWRCGPPGPAEHVRDGIAEIRTEKSGFTVAVTLPILPALSETILAGPCGELTFICGERGDPLTKESFGNEFRAAGKATGVPGSAHGVRKLAATTAANNGATVVMHMMSNMSAHTMTVRKWFALARTIRQQALPYLPPELPYLGRKTNEINWIFPGGGAEGFEPSPRTLCQTARQGYAPAADVISSFTHRIDRPSENTTR